MRNVGGKSVVTITNRSNQIISLILHRTTYSLAKSEVDPNKEGFLRLYSGSSVTIEYHRLDRQQVSSLNARNILQVNKTRSVYVYETQRYSWRTLTDAEWQDMTEEQWVTLS